MPQLPASIRVAAWTTDAWSRGADLTSSLAAALPDVDIVLGLDEQLALWRDLGESAVYAALPRPGARGLLPGCSDEAVAAAAYVGEAVFAPGLGALSVPRHVTFGAEQPGLALRWEAYDALPVPAFRLAGVDLAGSDRQLRECVHTVIDLLDDGGWTDAWQRQRPASAEREWGLPPLPERVGGLIIRAGAILEIAEAGLDHAQGSSTAALGARREAPLQQLREVATNALESAAAAAVSYLAAQSRATRS